MSLSLHICYHLSGADNDRSSNHPAVLYPTRGVIILGSPFCDVVITMRRRSTSARVWIICSEMASDSQNKASH